MNRVKKLVRRLSVNDAPADKAAAGAAAAAAATGKAVGGGDPSAPSSSSEGTPDDLSSLDSHSGGESPAHGAAQAAAAPTTAAEAPAAAPAGRAAAAAAAAEGEASSAKGASVASAACKGSVSTEKSLKPPAAQASARSKACSEKEAKSKAKSNGVGPQTNTASPGSRRLMREFRDMLTKSAVAEEMACDLVGDDLFEWEVRLKQIDPDSVLSRDMKANDIDEIVLRLKFPERYPFQPPFMRVVSPYILGGYVMEGGAICMELLTNEGWSGAYTAESVVRQFAASLVAGRARLGKTSGKNKVEYSLANAERSFKGLVKIHQSHGWYTPPKGKG